MTGDAWESDSDRRHPRLLLLAGCLLLTRGAGTGCVKVSTKVFTEIYVL